MEERANISCDIFLILTACSFIIIFFIGMNYLSQRALINIQSAYKENLEKTIESLPHVNHIQFIKSKQNTIQCHE